MTAIGRLRSVADRLDSWARVTLIVAVIALNGVFEESQVLAAEFMMLVRWTRDVLRYDFRWIVEEKLRLLGSRHQRPAKD